MLGIVAPSDKGLALGGAPDDDAPAMNASATWASATRASATARSGSSGRDEPIIDRLDR